MFVVAAGVRTLERPEALISSRSFEHRGVSVTEYLLATTTPGLRKLAWVRDRFEVVNLGGQPNPIVHSDFYHPGRREEYHTRTLVQRRFEEVWGL